MNPNVLALSGRMGEKTHGVGYVPQDEAGIYNLEPNLCHCLAGGRVPYMPQSEELYRGYTPEQADQAVFARFVGFAETIASLEPTITVALRIFNRPQLPSHQSRLEFVLLVKYVDEVPKRAEQGVEAAWQLVQYAFPIESPFNFPLERLPAKARDNINRSLSLEYLQQTLDARMGHVIDFSKFRDGFPLTDDLAFPHPYRSMANPQAITTLLATLAACQDEVVLSVSVRPSGLPYAEELEDLLHDVQDQSDQLDEQIQQERANLKIEDDEKARRIAERRIRARERERELHAHIQEYEQGRAWTRLGAYALGEIVRNRGRLLTTHIYLATQGSPHSAFVIQAIRSALMGKPLGEQFEESLQLRAPQVRIAVEQDLEVARDNLWWLEHQQWPQYNERQHSTKLDHLYRTTTPEEIASLLCLPVVGPHSQAPGVECREEPFFLPVQRTTASEDQEQTASIELGSVLHRGFTTDTPKLISLDAIKEHILITGRSGSGKTNTCIHLLRELHKQDKPFLVLDPLDKHDYRILLGDSALREKLLIFTLGDEQGTPLHFNPFEAPPGVGVRQHISQLLRCFLTAFQVWDPVPAIYRGALRAVYRQNGWDVDANEAASKAKPAPHSWPTFAEYYQVLDKVAAKQAKGYGADARGNIMQATRIRIGSLLEDNATILNVEKDNVVDPFAQIPDYPTVIELGAIGNDEDKALMMAFLLVTLFPRLRFTKHKLHVLVIEEAHRLMHRGRQPGESRADPSAQTQADFGNLLAEVRGYNQGIIVLDQIPAELTTSVFANAGTYIMHQLRDPISFDIMSSSFALSEAQETFARKLPKGHLITESDDGTPIHVRVKHVVDTLRKGLNDGELNDHNQVPDDVVKTLPMWHEVKRPRTQTYCPEEAAPPQPLEKLQLETLQACNACAQWPSQKCEYGSAIRELDESNLRKPFEDLATGAARASDLEARWRAVHQISKRFAVEYGVGPKAKVLLTYCFLRATRDRIQLDQKVAGRSQITQALTNILDAFPEAYPLTEHL